MKKLLSVAAIALVALCSCGHTESKAQTLKSAQPAFKTEKAKYERAINMSVDTEDVTEVKIVVDYPAAGPEIAVANIRNWMVDQLLDSSPFEKSASDYFTPRSGKDMVDRIGNMLADSAIAECQEFDLELSKSFPGYEFNWTETLEYSTPKYVSYLGTFFNYTGGAHGMTLYSPATFSLRNGVMLTWDNMFRPGYEAKLAGLIKGRLMRDYFHVSTLEEFDACIFESGIELPLPATVPYFTKNGVKFIYQQYEIAPFSAGAPSCTIPYKDIEPLLSVWAAGLISRDDKAPLAE